MSADKVIPTRAHNIAYAPHPIFMLRVHVDVSKKLWKLYVADLDR